MSDQPITPDQTAPQIPVSASADPSVLSAGLGNSAPAPPLPVLNESGSPEAADSSPSGGGSRLGAILGAVSKVASTGLAGIPESRRPGFISGLGSGARAEQQAQATQNAIKFKSFDDQVRLAELHAQDQKLQNDTQAQTDAHIKADLDNRALANSLGVDYDTIANHGSAVMDHLTAQTKANGAASVPPGTHLSGDGKTVNIPQDTQQTRDGQKAMYNSLAPALGLPSLPPGASFVPPKNMNMLTNKIHGFDINGEPIKHDDLPTYISTTQTQRDALAKNGASDDQLKTLDNMLGIYKANLNALDSHAADVSQKDAQAKAAGTIAAQTSPEAVAAEGKKAAGVKQAQLDVENSPANQAAAARGAAQKATAEEQAKGNDNLVVAYHPGYQNADGTTGANVVMTKGQAQTMGLQHYKADPAKLNATVAGFNDVQNKINMLADVANTPGKMDQVQAPVAAALLAHGKGIELGAFGTKLDMSAVNEDLYNANLREANQATRDYVTAVIGAHEAITQLPRLQTFGQSSRTTQAQMEAAVNLLPHPGDDSAMAQQKMTSLQQMLDPLRKQVPHMAGAETTPSWLEKKQQGGAQRSAAPQVAPTSVGRFNPQTQTIDYANLP